MTEEVVGHIIGGFVILEVLHVIALCWIVNRFTEKPLFKRRDNATSLFDNNRGA